MCSRASSFEIGHEPVSLIGRNGMGKSTLCNAIMQIRPPSAPRVDPIRGPPSSSACRPTRSPALGIGYVPQGRRLFQSLTVGEHLRMADARAAGDPRWNAERGLRPVPAPGRAQADNGGTQLSGGEQQMLAIGARAAGQPEAADHGRALRGARADDHRDADRDVPPAGRRGPGDPRRRAEPGDGDLDGRPPAGDGRRADLRRDHGRRAGQRPRGPAPLARRRAIAERGDDVITPQVVLVGTLDTKGDEYAFLRERIREAGVDVVLVDAGRSRRAAGARRRHTRGGGARRRRRPRRARARRPTAARPWRPWAAARPPCSSACTARAACRAPPPSAARATPRSPPRRCARCRSACPKLIVSTVASGDTRPYVGADGRHDDVLGRRHRRDQPDLRADPGQRRRRHRRHGDARATPTRGDERPLVGATMFGVTTPCVTRARERLEELGYEVLVFHATGTGGQSLEALAAGGFLAGALDVTTTELADELVGGVLSAGPDRLEAAGRVGHPAGRLAGRAGHGQLRPARDRARAVRGPQPLRAQPDGHADAHDAGGERRARPPHRAQAQRGRVAHRAVRAARGRLGDRRRGPAVPRPRGRRARCSTRCARRIDPAASRSTRSTPTSTTPRSPTAMADRLHELIQAGASDPRRGARAAARRRSSRAARSSAPARARACRPSAPRPAAPT